MDCTDSLVTLQKAWQISTRQAHLPAVEQRLQAAAGLALTRPARRTLRQLGASGFIAREQGEDQRAVRISLTSAGEEAVARLLAAGQIILRDVLSGWSENDRDALSRLMVRFADDFSTYLRQTSNQNREREVESWA